MALTNEEREVLKSAMAIIERETAENGDKLMLRGFGTFKRKAMPARTARNPQTGDPVEIPERSVFRFTAAKGQSRQS